jgi:predicted metal-dependent enzyme (double-stranded beta helix superfamily)
MRTDVHQHLILGRYGRDLTRQELRGAAARLALRPDSWTSLVRHDRDQRVYEELFRDEHLSAWLICWMPGHDTGFHDHAGASGAVAVVSGSVLEQRLGPVGNSIGSVYSRSEVFDFGPHDIHRVRHHGSAPATTLHTYSPPLSGMGSYLAEDGRLERRELPYEEELRPLDIA